MAQPPRLTLLRATSTPSTEPTTYPSRPLLAKIRVMVPLRNQKEGNFSKEVIGKVRYVRYVSVIHCTARHLRD